MYSFFMTPSTRKAIGAKIRKLREESNLTQDKLALMVGVERSYLAKVEAGTRNASIDVLEKIAGGFGLSLSEFFSGI
ncbi:MULTISPECIES: helix-turn-helix domain-containing protein [unclassified Adlercreutzia]|uniref:helix-turn-helix domain-containing protein n=1 Tax=unclassified Adlercreutzia TaxID=2636013 RepID=UPI001F153027|nr:MULTISPECIES: helix-turn-helix transcriptional regulator [unclassified Adlercreutzia]